MYLHEIIILNPHDIFANFQSKNALYCVCVDSHTLHVFCSRVAHRTVCMGLAQAYNKQAHTLTTPMFAILIERETSTVTAFGFMVQSKFA